MFAMSDHAVRRALDMGVEGDEIRDAFLNPRFIGNTSNGRELRTRGRISLVVTKETIPPVVVTVLWATANGWVQDHEHIGSRTGPDAEHMERLRRARKSQKRRTRGRGY